MTLLIVIHIILCLFLILVVLLQPGKSDGAVGFGSSSQSIFGSKGAGNFLTKTTSIVGTAFFVTGFLLSFPKCTGKRESDMTPTPVTSPSPAPSAAAASPSPVPSPSAAPVEAPKK